MAKRSPKFTGPKYALVRALIRSLTVDGSLARPLAAPLDTSIPSARIRRLTADGWIQVSMHGGVLQFSLDFVRPSDADIEAMIVAAKCDVIVTKRKYEEARQAMGLPPYSRGDAG